MADGMDYLVSGLAGAASGFFSNQQKENAEAKLQLENERQAKLLELKDQRLAAREMAKQKDQQTFELSKQGSQQNFEMKKQEHAQAFTGSEAIAKRLAEESGDEAKNEFELKKQGIENANRVKVAEIGAAGKKGRGGLTEMQEFKLETDLAKLEDVGVTETNVNQVNTLRSNLGMPIYQKKVTPGVKGGMFSSDTKEKVEYVLSDTGQSSSGPDVQSIFNNIGASRTKQSANDGAK